MSRPAVLSEIGESPEMIEEGVNGYIYPRGHVDGLVCALIALIDDPRARQNMGDSARRIVEEKSTFTRMVRDYEEILLPCASEQSMHHRENRPAWHEGDVWPKQPIRCTIFLCPIAALA